MSIELFIFINTSESGEFLTNYKKQFGHVILHYSLVYTSIFCLVIIFPDYRDF